HPNEYYVYLELPDQQGASRRLALADEWTPRLLEQLIAQPSAGDLATTHQANPIALKVFVRSRGEDEFAGDDQRGKKSYVVRRKKAPELVPAPVLVAAGVEVSS